MKIINIVDNVLRVNFGIWNAAVFASDVLENEHDIQSEIWFPEIENMPKQEEFLNCKPFALKNLSLDYLKEIISERNFDKNQTLIITHGCWQYPTKWGNYFAKNGFSWIYVPHGMLEPWSMSQKKLLKFLYFNLIEKPLVKFAKKIRAVSVVEKKNLEKSFPKDKIFYLPNGCKIQENLSTKSTDRIEILFLGRLHSKKSVMELLEAFLQSSLKDNPKYFLRIIGPDHGLKEQMEELIKKKNPSNVIIGNPVKGKEKEDLLKRANFFVLPSKSEGFPTSVVEAISFGCIPIISDGCNFPEIFQKNLAIKVGSDTKSILDVLNNLENFVEKEDLTNWQNNLKKYSSEDFSDIGLAKKMIEKYF